MEPIIDMLRKSVWCLSMRRDSKLNFLLRVCIEGVDLKMASHGRGCQPLGSETNRILLLERIE